MKGKIMFNIFKPNREKLIEQIEQLLEVNPGRGGSERAEELMEKLAELDGSRFNGWYYYHTSVAAGGSPQSGLSGALEHGGFMAGAAYADIMGKGK